MENMKILIEPVSWFYVCLFVLIFALEWRDGDFSSATWMTSFALYLVAGFRTAASLSIKAINRPFRPSFWDAVCLAYIVLFIPIGIFELGWGRPTILLLTPLIGGLLFSLIVLVARRIQQW
jgi:hypothetical protein